MLRDEHLYIHTYYRMDSGYPWKENYSERIWAFNFDILKILDSIGFTTWKKSGHGCYFEGFRGNCENLYCHPTSISGWVRKDKLEEIADALKKGKTFKFWHIDTYEEAYNYTVIELEALLKEKEEAIVQQILERFRTPRKNLYKRPDLNIQTGISYLPKKPELNKVTGEFIESLFDNLVGCGKIAKAEVRGNLVYRTAVPVTGVTSKRKVIPIPEGNESLFGKEPTECQTVQ